MKALLPLAPLLLTACSTLPTSAPTAPHVDYHQHLVSPAWAPIAKMPPRDGATLLAEMDRAGVRQAVVLSTGYSYADERKKLPDPDGLTRAENDWTSAQVAAARGRLIGFCSANPLREAALAELERCLNLPGMRGIKQHVGNAGVSFRDPAQVAQLAQVFALAQRRRVPVLVHMRPRGGSDYGAQDVTTFFDRLVAAAPGVPIIVAHLGASSPNYPAQNDEIMAAFAAAAARRDPRVANLYFDPAANVTEQTTAAQGALIARRMREIGVGKFVYGSDLSAPGGSIGAGWQIFRTKVPQTPAEFALIARQRLPFTR